MRALSYLANATVHPHSLCLVLAIALFTSEATAQEQPAAPPDTEPAQVEQAPVPNMEQTKLYERAVEAYRNEDYTTTIVLLQTANRIQPFDLFSYNIARASIKAGQCVEAEQAYQDAKVHPKLGPPLDEDIEAGLKELEVLCAGQVTITCAAPDQTRVSVDGSPEQLCAGLEPQEVKSGTHVVVATLDTQIETYPFEVAGLQSTEVRVTLEPIFEPRAFASKKWGALTAGTGAGLFVGALVLDNTLVRARNQSFRDGSANSIPYEDLVLRRQRLRRSQAMTLTAAGLGVIGMAIGSTLWFRAHVDERGAQAIVSLRF